MDALNYLTGIAVILLLGILASIIAKKLKTSNILLLIAVGLLIGNTALKELPIFAFDPTFIIAIAIITLAIVVFDGTSQFNFRDLDELSAKGLELVLLFILFSIIIITIIFNLFFFHFSAQGILFGIILAVLMVATDPASTFILFGDKPNRVLQFLRVEAIINTPIMVLLPFLLIDLLQAQGRFFTTFIEFLEPFFLQILVGIGAGMLVGTIIFRVMKRWYSENISPVAVISSTLLAYILAENLGGNGVLAVAVLGLLFGNTYVQKKGTLVGFSNITAYSLQILVFVLIGLFVTLPSSWLFWLASISILLGTILARYAAIVLLKLGKNKREIMFMTLNMPKGIATAVVVLTLALLPIEGLDEVLSLTIIVMIYSLIISTITTMHAKYFLREAIEFKE